MKESNWKNSVLVVTFLKNFERQNDSKLKPLFSGHWKATAKTEKPFQWPMENHWNKFGPLKLKTLFGTRVAQPLNHSGLSILVAQI